MSRNLMKPRKKPSQRRSKETVNIILEAAIQIFQQKGYSNTTTNHIADRAGVSIGTIYQYFPNKDSILTEMMDRHIEEVKMLFETFTFQIESGLTLSRDITFLFIKTLLNCHKKQPVYHQLLMQDIPLSKQHLISWARTTETKSIELLRKVLLRLPGVRRKNSELAARTIAHAANALIHRYILCYQEKIVETDFIEELNDMLQRYLFN